MKKTEGILTMKRVTIFLTVALMLAALGCGSKTTANTSDAGRTVISGEPTITLTTAVGVSEITISLAGSGAVTIDWGDGTTETHELPEYYGWSLDAGGTMGERLTLQHRYAIAATRRITIFGENIIELVCNNAGLTAIDVKNATALESLECSGNLLTALDVSNNTGLLGLSCHSNRLTTLDVSANTALEGLWCHNNQLTALDVRRNPNLYFLVCSNNQLTALNLGANTNLYYVNIGNNRFTAASLNALFETLHENVIMGPAMSTQSISISGNPGSADCTPRIAVAKGWRVHGFEKEPAISINDLDKEMIARFFTMSIYEIIDLLGYDYTTNDYYASQYHIKGYSWSEQDLEVGVDSEGIVFIRQLPVWDEPASTHIILPWFFRIYGLEATMNFDQIEYVLGAGYRYDGDNWYLGYYTYNLAITIDDYVLVFSSKSRDGANAVITAMMPRG